MPLHPVLTLDLSHGHAFDPSDVEVFTSVRLTTNLVGEDRSGATSSVPVPRSQDLTLLWRLSSAFPTFHITAHVLSESLLVCVDVYVDASLLRIRMRDSKTFEGEAAFFAALATVDPEVIRFEPVVYDGVKIREDAPELKVSTQLVRAAKVGGITISDHVQLTGSGWFLDLARHSVTQSPTPDQYTITPNGWVVKMPPGRVRTLEGCNLLVGLRTEGVVVGVDHRLWRVRTRASLVVCAPDAVERWRSMISRHGLAAGILTRLAGHLAIDMDAIDVIVVSTAVLSSPEYVQLTKECCSNPWDVSRYVRLLPKGASPWPLMQAYMWKTLIVDDCDFHSDLIMMWQACARFLMTDRVESVEELTKAVRFTGVTARNTLSAVTMDGGAGCATPVEPRMVNVRGTRGVSTAGHVTVHPFVWLGVHVSRSQWITRCGRSERSRRLTARDVITPTIANSEFGRGQVEQFAKQCATCPICLDGKASVISSCGHMFCAQCFQRLGSFVPNEAQDAHHSFQRNCPVCREKITAGASSRPPKEPRVQAAVRLCARATFDRRVIVYSNLSSLLDATERLLQSKYPNMCVRRYSASSPESPPVSVLLVLAPTMGHVPILEGHHAVWMHAPHSNTRCSVERNMWRLGHLCDRITVLYREDTPEAQLVALVSRDPPVEMWWERAVQRGTWSFQSPTATLGGLRRHRVVTEPSPALPTQPRSPSYSPQEALPPWLLAPVTPRILTNLRARRLVYPDDVD